MVDKRLRTADLHPLQEGVAALAPQFDLALSISSRRTAAPIGSLSPQGTPFGLLPGPNQPPTSTDPDSTDIFGLASLDLGPPVFDPPPPSFPPVFPPVSPPAPSPLSPRIRDNAHPTRCVLLRNIPPGIDDDDLRHLLLRHGPLRDLGAQQRSRGGRGSVLAVYYDLRHARAAVRALDGAVQFGRRIDARFQCPVEGAGAANQGTLVVFNLDHSTSAEDIRTLFSSVGDVKEIRATPNKKHHKFVEFYDVRDAERAMRLLNKTDVAGKRIKIEISRPGGRAATNLARHMSAPAPKHSPPQQNSNLNHQPAAHHRLPHLPHVQYNPEQPFRALTPPPPLDLSPQLIPRPAPRLPQSSPRPQFPSSPDPAIFDTRSISLPALPNLSAAFDPPSLQPLQQPLYNGPHHDDFPPPYHSFDAPSSAPDPLGSPLARDLPKSFPLPVSAPQAPTPRYPADSYIQALYSSPSSDDNHTRKALSPGPQSPAAPARSPFVTGLLDASASEMPGVNLYKHAFADDSSAFQPNSGPKRPGRGGPMRPAVVGAQSPVCGVGPDRGYGQKGGPNGKAVGAKTHFQQSGPNAKYALDIRKVRAGEEMRTALMIRNIPNKYNQKMLLSTLEEEHRGHFDFIYLPIDFKNKCNVGYAFINFTKPQYIEPFYHRFHGKKWGRFNSEKVCEITFARIQGRQQLIAHFQNSSLLLEDPKCRPVIFDAKGRQEEFPIGSHVRTRRGPSSRDASHRACDGSPPFSPTKQHRGRS